MSQAITLSTPQRYQIQIQGQPPDSWRDWFGEANVHVEVWSNHGQVTTFSNLVMDQAALVGLIRRLHGRGIVLLSIQTDLPLPLRKPQKTTDNTDETDFWEGIRVRPFKPWVACETSSHNHPHPTTSPALIFIPKMGTAFFLR